MAVIETWIKTDLKKIVRVNAIGGNVFSQDNMANLIGVELLDNGQPASVSGSVSANVLRADGATVAVAGTLSGNLASVTLPQAAYAVPGMLRIVIKLTDGSTVTTIGAVQAIVYKSSTDTIVDPGTIIPSVQDLIAAIDAAVASIPPDYSELTGEVSDLKNALSARTTEIGSWNLWNEMWTVGNINGTTGLPSTGSLIRSLVPIQVEPNTQYCVVAPSNSGIRLFYYKDEAITTDNYISYSDPSMANGYATFTTPSTCHYMMFRCSTVYGTTYNNNIAINYPSTRTSYTPHDSQDLKNKVLAIEGDINSGLPNYIHGGGSNITSTTRAAICSSDLNNVAMNTVYGVVPDSGLSNAPTDETGLLVTFSKTGTVNNTVVQVYYTLNGVYERMYYSSAWQAWGYMPSNAGVAYVAYTGSDSNRGTAASPFFTVNKALKTGASIVYIDGGIYLQQIDLQYLKHPTLTLLRKDPSKRVIFCDPDYVLTDSETKLDGYTKIYYATISTTISSKCRWLYQNNVPDANTLISDADRHPLQSGYTYRCPDTKITMCSAESLSAAKTEIEESDGYKWYLDGTTLYFSRPQTVNSTYPISISTRKSLLLNKDSTKSVKAIGIETHYMNFAVDELANAELYDCKCVNSNSPSGFYYTRCNTKMVRCEVCCVQDDDGLGDGISANSSYDGDAKATQSVLLAIDCWSHDNNDDGFSDHYRAESTLIGGLYEENGKGGVTPSFGAHCTCYDVTSRYNGNGFYYVGEASADEGGVGGQLTCIGCIASSNGVGNHVNSRKAGYAAANSGNVIRLVDCLSIGNKYGFWTDSTAKIDIMNCGADGNETLKQGSTIMVSNTTLVT